MSSFYRSTHNSIQAIIIATGASAFASLLPSDHGRWSWAPKFLTAAVTVLATLDLIFDLSKKADVHTDLMRRFTALAADMTEWTADETHYRRAKGARLRIEADEPPVRRLIDLRAENDERRSRGLERMVPLTVLQRTSPLAYFMDFGMAKLEQRNALAKRWSETS